MRCSIAVFVECKERVRGSIQASGSSCSGSVEREFYVITVVQRPEGECFPCRPKHAIVFDVTDETDDTDSTLFQNCLTSRSRANAIKRGERVCDRTLGIRRKLLLAIATELARVGTFDNDLKRLVVVLVYHAVGRGGEVAFLNLSGMRFDQDDHGLWTGWGEVKTGHDNDLPYYPNKEEWLTCALHALGVYIISAIHNGKLNRNPNIDEPIWLLPDFQGLANGGAATKITRILSELEKTKKVEGLSEKHTSHGLRAGPSDDLALNEAVDVISIICRGNWCVMFVSVGFWLVLQ